MVVTIIVAAGEGKRIGSDIPKQFLLLNGKPILWHTLYVFEKSPAVDEIVLVINPLWKEMSQKIAKDFFKIKHIVIGGKTRQESVWAGLKAVKKADIILVHDGVRPFVSQELIKRVINSTYKYKAVVPALPANDTVKWVEDNIVKKTLPREFIWFAQTPQGFKFDIIKNAYSKYKKETFTDDAALVEKLGINVYVVTGELTNIKITTPEDLKWAEILLDFQ